MTRILPAGLLVGISLLAFTSPASAQGTEPGQPATARALLTAIGAERAFVDGLEGAIPAQKASAPQIPEVFWTRTLAKAKAAAPQLLDSLAPMYAQEFTEGELKQLLQFFDSPIGRKYAETQRALTERTQALGYRWGVRIGADVAKELADEGIKLQ